MWAEVFQIYPNGIHLNPLQFYPSMLLLGFPVFCLSSSIVLNRYFHILVNSMAVWSVLKLPKIAWSSPFKELINSIAILTMILTLCSVCRPDDNRNLFSISLLVINGVYLEKWNRIDYKRVKFLLGDPRYPNLPSFATCVPTFEQPSNWGDFFGSRMRTYFVPLQSGNHFFYLCKRLWMLKLITYSFWNRKWASRLITKKKYSS